MRALRAWFRKRFNRVLVVNLIILCMLLLTWYLTMSYPLVLSFLPGDRDLFYGKIHHARQSPILGRIVFRMHGDNEAEYLLWIDRENRSELDGWFGPDVPLEVVAFRVAPRIWVVEELSSPYGTLDFDALEQYRLRMAFFFLAVASFIGSVLLFAVSEYWLWFRRRPWFSLWRSGSV